MQHLLIFLAALAAATTSCSCAITEWPLTLHHDIQASVDRTNEVNGLGALPVVDPPYHSAGYMPLNNTEDAKLFYFYFQERSKNTDAPLLFWTNGGPGCSSMFGLFEENGPYVIQPDLSLKWREYGWDVGQNVIFVDQPVGTGFSEGDDKYYAHYEDTVGLDVLIFLQEFMELHPELKGKDLYLSGESYAGHYLPAIANAIHKSNGQRRFQHLNLKGVMMGNPWTSPASMYPSFAAFAESHGLITKTIADDMLAYFPECKEGIDVCNETKNLRDCITGQDFCERQLVGRVLEANPNMNPYDIRKRCIGDLCYNTSLVEKYLNSPKVQAQLGVHKEWNVCASKVGYYMRGDGLLDMGPTVHKLLDEGLRFLVYVGDQDFICNWMGNKAWLDSMAWKKANLWTGSLKTWEVDTKDKGSQAAGECESVEPLTFCKVSESGHMVPMDQPQNALAMVHTFIAGESFVKADPSISVGRLEEGSGEIHTVS